MSAKQPLHIVVNPISGRVARGGVIARLSRRAREAGWPVTVTRTGGAGHAAEAARRACLARARALVVVGGDGTVSEAAGGMCGAGEPGGPPPRSSGVPMLVLPSGTENVLAKYLGSTLDAERAWRVLQAGREVAFDVPMMNGRRFLLMGGVGFDAECVRRVAAARGGHIGYLDYFSPILRTFWECRNPEISVVADGDLIFEGSGLAYVGNIPRYAVGLKILRDAVPDDGLLDVCILACRGRMGVLRHAWNVWRQRHVGREGVIYRRARNLRISAGEPVPVQLDGDLAGGLPAEFVMTSARVRFLIE